MSQVGYQKALQVKTTSTTAYLALPANSANVNLAGEMLDDTDFNSTGWRSRIRGLKDYSFSAPSFYNSSDTGLAAVRSALLSGVALDVRYLPNGTNGFQGRVLVESFSNSGDVGGLETVDISLQSVGTPLTTV